MTQSQKEAILGICLNAAFADGRKSEEERNKIKVIISNIEIDNTSQIYENVLTKQTNYEEIAKILESAELKTLAYEMAVAICDSDGLINSMERAFLDSLKNSLKIGQAQSSDIEKKAEEILITPAEDMADQSPLLPKEEEIDKMILNYAKLNAALELLPQSLATLAIIPLQSKMVYEISKKYGFELDNDHIKEFIATIGIGLTSQTLEGYARRLFGGLSRKVAGGLAKTVASALTGAAFSFGSTYGLGKVAYSYYSSGRKLNMEKLKDMFNNFKNDGMKLFSKYEGEIQNKAKTINLGEIVSVVKGK